MLFNTKTQKNELGVPGDKTGAHNGGKSFDNLSLLFDVKLGQSWCIELWL